MLQLKMVGVGGVNKPMLCGGDGGPVINQVAIDVFQGAEGVTFTDVRFAVDNEKVKLS